MFVHGASATSAAASAATTVLASRSRETQS